MKRYTVLVVDDSAFMRKIITDLIQIDSKFEVIGYAKNGIEAIEQTILLKPDAITLDVEMPQMNGLVALKNIMKIRPTPTIMLSSLTGVGAIETIKALEYGAVDFVQKPSGSISLDMHKVSERLREKLMLAIQIRFPNKKKIEASTISRKRTQTYVAKQVKSPREVNSEFNYLVALGTSTGGPRALQEVITNLPANFPAPILVVQHMPKGFTKSLADRLNEQSQLHVAEANEDMVVKAGSVYIAPGGRHMTVKRISENEHRISLSDAPARTGHRPSIDMLFDSLVPLNNLTRIAVLMTGMGSDGVEGMAKLFTQKQIYTIAQSEQTSTIFGMPRAAIERKVIHKVVDLHEISTELISFVSK